jgi:hypothetical protein
LACTAAWGMLLVMIRQKCSLRSWQNNEVHSSYAVQFIAGVIINITMCFWCNVPPIPEASHPPLMSRATCCGGCAWLCTVVIGAL